MPAYEDHDHENDVIYFARTNYRNQMRKFGIKTDDRRRHTYVIGKTGMGKTTLLENMILSDIYLGHGCAYVDPHGDTAEKLINYIPEWRLKDVVYFCPSDVEYPVGFNILESTDINTRHVIASGLMGVFKKIWPDVWSARMEHILNNCLMTLLENPGNTLMGVNRLLVDRDFRVRMVSNLKDPVVKAFWITEFEQWEPKFRTEAIAPIQNKVGQFLSTAVVRNIVAQEKSTIKPREIMDSSKIFIVNLSKGRIGEDAMRLLGGMLITKMQLCAMERVDIPEIERRDFYLYIDEFQNFATESFASILSEARKYRLALIMAHQFIEQLTEEVRAAVFGNVGTILLFRVGSPDAAFLETEFMPRFTPEDLVNLTKYEIYLRLMIDGVSSEPFSALTLPPIAQKTDSMATVIEYSRANYARTREVVADEILRWSEMEGGSEEPTDVSPEVAEQFKVAEDRRKATKKFGNKPLFDYDCTRCNKHMILPVELDTNRPIYCEDCIEIVREERKSGKGRSEERPREAKTAIAPAVSEGELITKESDTSMSLSALKPKETIESKPVAPAELAEPAADLPKPEIKLTPSLPLVSNPVVVPVVSPLPVSSPSSSVVGDSEEVRRKRKRHRKKSGGGQMVGSSGFPASAGTTSPVSQPIIVPRPPVVVPRPPVSSGSKDDIFPW